MSDNWDLLFKLIVIGDTGTGQIHLLSPPPAVLLTALSCHAADSRKPIIRVGSCQAKAACCTRF